MRVEAELLVPGMEDAGSADATPAVARVGGDGPQCLVRCPEQDADQDPAVGEADPRDLWRKGEDHVEVRHGQDVGGARLHPFSCRVALAGRAVPVPARVVERVFPPAAVTVVQVATEDCRAAGLDGTHDLSAARIEHPVPCLPVSGSGAVEDLRHARRLRHVCGSGRDQGRA